MIKVIIDPGSVVNGLTIVKELQPRIFPSGKKSRKFELICPYCDKHFTALYEQFVRKKTNKHGPIKSCGCLKYKEKEGAYSSRNKKFGGSTKTPEYRTYLAMKQRCTNPKHNRYQAYGGRGIKICDRWFESFQNFLEDMGPRPTITHSIDRIDVNGNYEPLNCKWATPEEQQVNKRSRKGEERVKIKPGDRFGKLTITDYAEPYVLKTGKEFRRMKVICDCGTETIYNLTDLNTGKKTACSKCSN